MSYDFNSGLCELFGLSDILIYLCLYFDVLFLPFLEPVDKPAKMDDN
jgi:hypothetical protein